MLICTSSGNNAKMILCRIFGNSMPILKKVCSQGPPALFEHPESQLASNIWSVISVFHAVPLENKHHQELEKEKVSHLKKEGGYFEAEIALNQQILTELIQWLDAMLLSLAGKQQMGSTQLKEYGQDITRHTI